MSHPIRVVNVRGLNRPEQRAQVVYCGRPFAGWKGHVLANPFKPRKVDESITSKGDEKLAQFIKYRDELESKGLKDCLAWYREWLLARQTLSAELAALWEECQHGLLPLGCWCVNATAGDGSEVVCHAQILAEMLHERFGAK